MQRVLIVENHENLACALQDGLERLPSCCVTVAHRGDQALRLLQGTFFHLLVTDYHMPGIDGITLAEKVRQLYPEMAIIVLTAYPNDWLYERAAELSIRCILEKPIPLADIRTAVLDAMRHRYQDSRSQLGYATYWSHSTEALE